MTIPVRTVPMSSGYQWCLAALALPWRSRTGVGALALLYGVRAQATSSLMTPDMPPITLAATMLANLLLATLIVVGMLYASRECDQGRPSDLRALLAQLGSAELKPLGAVLLPQLAMLAAVLAIVYIVIGADDLQRLGAFYADLQAKVAQGVPVSPDALMALPLGSLLLAGALLAALCLCCAVFGLTLIPDLLFGGKRLWAGMRDSAVACLRNAPAVVLLFATAFGACVAAVVVIGLLQELLALAMGGFAYALGQVALQAFGGVLFCGATYFAWKDMCAGAGDGAGATRG